MNSNIYDVMQLTLEVQHMKTTITQNVTMGEVLDQIETKLGEIALLENATNLTQQEMHVMKQRIELTWQVVSLRVAELRTLVASLKQFNERLTGGPDGGVIQ